VLPVIMLILGAGFGSASPAGAGPSKATASSAVEDASNSPNGPPAPEGHRKSPEAAGSACGSQDTRNIMVCGERRQPYRLDPSVMKAGREAESNSRSATAPMPPAQAACSASKTGCEGFGSLDLANVAVVVGTMAIRAAKGKDWTRAFRVGGPNEYQLYQQSKQRREAADAERAAAEVKRKAEEAEREVHAARVDAN